MNKSSRSMPICNKCIVSILGLGYVGLPLAISLSKRKLSFLNKEILERKVFGFDINHKRIEDLKKGFDKTNEISKDDLLSQKNLYFTHDLKDLYGSDVYIISVPTPIDKFRKPNLNALENASKFVGKIIKNRKNKNLPIIIYESTVYPGATEEVCIPIIESESNQILNSDFYVGYSPERINPGDEKYKLEHIVKVTSGSCPKAANWIDLFYGSIIKAGTHLASSIKVAEAAKVIENTQRDLNIALVNELAFIFNKLDIPTNEVLKAARTKWNFLDFKPGLVGGHCIGVDPYYLTYKAKCVGHDPKVLLAGREINNKVSSWVVEKLVENLSRKKIKIFDTDVLILGYAFKENFNDSRNSKVLDIINNLKRYNMNSVVVDHLVDKAEAYEESNISILKEIPKNKKFSALIIAVAHEKFCLMKKIEWKNIIKSKNVIVDIKNILPMDIDAVRL